MLQLLVTANVMPCSLTLSVLIMQAIRSTEKSVLTRATRRQILENGIPRGKLALRPVCLVSEQTPCGLVTQKCIISVAHFVQCSLAPLVDVAIDVTIHHFRWKSN
jgi:hypothetical protein